MDTLRVGQWKLPRLADPTDIACRWHAATMCIDELGLELDVLLRQGLHGATDDGNHLVHVTDTALRLRTFVATGSTDTASGPTAVSINPYRISPRKFHAHHRRGSRPIAELLVDVDDVGPLNLVSFDFATSTDDSRRSAATLLAGLPHLRGYPAIAAGDCHTPAVGPALPGRHLRMAPDPGLVPPESILEATYIDAARVHIDAGPQPTSGWALPGARHEDWERPDIHYVTYSLGSAIVGMTTITSEHIREISDHGVVVVDYDLTELRHIIRSSLTPWCQHRARQEDRERLTLVGR